MKKLLLGLCRPINCSFHNFIFTLLFVVSAYCSGQSVDNYLEKVYLDLDKTYYLADEIIWFKAYLVDGRTNTKALSEVLYVDLIDPASNIVTTKTLKISEVGGGAGEFQLSSKLISGEYTIRAYTNYMRDFNNAYFFRKKIYIENFKKEDESEELISNSDAVRYRMNTSKSSKKPDLQFLPEGGVLVNEVSNRVAFKIVDITGKSITVKGVIKDADENEITEIATSKFGMGTFMFKPQKGSKYKAYVNFKNKEFIYDIPVAVDNGIAMIVRNNQDFVRIILQSTLLNGVNGLSLVGKQYGQIISRVQLNANTNISSIIVKKEKLRQGIVEFTVFDNKDRPLCERLIFIDNETQVKELTFHSIKNTYENRELIEFDITQRSPLENSISSNMSISVSEVADTVPVYDLDIKSQLLLKSELKGTIEQPSYYFKSKDPDRKRYLDVLMMTQGWRKYVWNEKIPDSLQKDSYSIEKGFRFKGNVSNFYNHDKKKASKVEISFVNDKGFSSYDLNTSEKGSFRFGDFDITDSTTVIITAKSLKKKKNGKSNNSFMISLDSFQLPIVDKEFVNGRIDPYRFNMNEKFIVERLNRYKETQDFNSIFNSEEDVIELESIHLKTVKSKLEKIRESKRGMYSNPSNTLDMDELNFVPTGLNFLTILNGRVPGVQVVGDNVIIRGRSSLLGSSSALIVYDGMPMESSAVSSINPNDVDFIDVLKGAAAAIYGSRGANGVVLIYSKDGRSEMLKDEERERKNYVRKGIINFDHPGYSKAKEFYSPMYNVDKSENKIDYRSTLYWNPNLQLSDEGTARVSFYSSDIKSKYRIEIEGITSDGVPIVEESFITVE